MSRCNKCGQGDPHLSDSWCLACTSLEALNGELRLAWGSPGRASWLLTCWSARSGRCAPSGAWALRALGESVRPHPRQLSLDVLPA